MSKLLEKLRKNTVVDAEILKNSKYFQNETFFPTRVPLLNVAFTGSFDGGMPKGITMIAAPPKHFKTYFMLECIRSFQEANEGKDHITVFYDSEKGSTPAYFESAGIDTGKVDHRPIVSIEQLKSDIANLTNDIGMEDSVLICIDSLGMLPSKKEAEDALNDKHVVDMTRAKQIKSLFRIITPHVVFKNIPVVVVNHSYQTQDMFPKEVAAGGRGAQYAGHTLWFISKAQEKDGDDLAGFRFTVKSGLSRYVRENSTFPITVLFGDGIQENSGLFDLALEFGIYENVTKQTYRLKGSNDEKGKKQSTIEEDPTFVSTITKNPEFVEKIIKKYRI